MAAPNNSQNDAVMAELRASEARLREAERMAQLGYWERDYVNRRITLSEEAYRILGVTPEQRVDDLAECERMWMEAVHPDDRARVMEAAREALAGRAPYDIEYRLRRLDGETRVLSSRGSVTRDEHGQPVRFFGYFHDITELKRLETQFLQAQKMEAVGQLAGGLAHDFNNLLMVISACTELLLEAVSEPSQRALLDEVRASSTRAAALTRQLLAFSGKQLLQPRVIDVNSALAAVLQLLSRVIGADIDIQLRTAAADARAKVDPGQLEQALVNLAINARDAMPDGGQLTLETADIEDYVMVAVRDTGQGMDDATRAHIFEPFFTTKGPTRGTGLGLAMVQGFVVQSGGHIDVESVPGQGTTFRISLPRAERHERPQPVSPSPRREPAGGTETILLAEDEDALRVLIARALTDAGYTVLEGRTGDETLAVARRHNAPIQLLITDLVMPGMGGWRLAEQLTNERPTMRVLFMSGHATELILQQLGAGQSVAYLQKPFAPLELLRRTRELLDGKT